MCTSFVWRSGGGVLVAMNFDNADPFTVEAAADRFVVHSVTARGSIPTFGVTRDGTFVNHLLVDDHGQGRYKRASRTVTHTTRLVADILSGTITAADLDDYLGRITVTNVPDMCAHCLITDRFGDAWVVEPGRGTISSPAPSSPFLVMTNFELCDTSESRTPCGSGADRYVTATSLLAERDDLSVAQALEVLGATRQVDGDWPTVFSLIYSVAENAVFTCGRDDFGTLERHAFPATCRSADNENGDDDGCESTDVA